MNLLKWLTPNQHRSLHRQHGANRFQLNCAHCIQLLEKRELLTLDGDGWSQFADSVDSQVFYVSSSSGNDINSGLTPDAPFATLEKAIRRVRNGYADRVLLKSGDSFYANLALEKSGRSLEEPFLISGYGDGPRPVINGPGFMYWHTNIPLGYSLNHVAIVGLDFRGTGTNSAMLMRGNMNGILIEGNTFTNYNASIQIDTPKTVDSNGNPYLATNVSIRRNDIFQSDEQGVLLGKLDETLIEGNVFDLNGYGEGMGNLAGETGPTIFKHDLYVGNMHGLIIRDNIFARGSNFGTKLKSTEVNGFTNFVIENNLYFNNGLSLDTGGSPSPGLTTYRHRDGVVKDNVFTELGREFANGIRQDLAVYAINAAEVNFDGNFFVHKSNYAQNPMFVWASKERSTDITIQNSVVYDWALGPGKSADRYFETKTSAVAPLPGGITNFQLANNQIDLAAASYVDPNRTVGSYYASIGGTNDAVAFLIAARQMSKSNWDVRFTADAVNDYIRDGFTPVLANPVFTTPAINATTNNPLQTISWNTIDGAEGYDVWYSSLTTNQNPLFRANVTSASYTPEVLLPIGTYQISVRATQNKGPSSGWSAPLTLRINTAPVVDALPSDSANARPQLTWAPLPGAVSYEVWAHNLTTGTRNVIRVSSLTDTTFSTPTDLGFGKYRFWVRGFDVKGKFTAWSTAQDYSRRNATTELQPVVFDGMNSTPTITWGSVPGAVRYELRASNLTTGVNGVVRSSDISNLSFVPLKPLPFGKNRFWVRPIDANEIVGKWSLPVDSVNRPALISPIAPTFELRPTFTWVLLPGVLSSELYIRVNGTVINPKGVQGASWSPDEDLPIGQLRWFVRSSGANGMMGPWSAPSDAYIGGRTSIITAGVPANAPDRTAAFSWQAVTGAIRYELCVRRLGFGAVILEENLTETSYITSVPLEVGEFRVWVKAIAASDNVSGVWSTLRAFSAVETELEIRDSAEDPQFALRQLPSALSDGCLAVPSQPRIYHETTAPTQNVRSTEALLESESKQLGNLDVESTDDWEQPRMSGDALMSENNANLIDAVMADLSLDLAFES